MSKKNEINEDQGTNKFLSRMFIWMCVFVAVLIIGYALVMMFAVPQNVDWATRGQFGDMFGLINTIFSGLAFAGLIYTAMMQRIELSFQREELTLQRKEMELTRGELEKQSHAQQETEKALKDQAAQQRQIQAEGTFFNLLNSIRSMVANTEGEIIPKKTDTYSNTEKTKASGVQYFSAASKEIKNRVTAALSSYLIFEVTNNKQLSAEQKKEAHDLAVKTYNDFFKDHSPELAHYFRFTFNVLNFVNTHPDIPKEKKDQYINFVQSQMSDSELLLVYFNGTGEHGEKYYELIEEYDLLQNMNTSLNKGVIELLDDFYPKSSFRD